MKTFEVIIKAVKTVIIEAENKEDAEQIASEECTSFNWEIDSWNAEELMTEREIEGAQRHGAIILDNWNG